LDLSAKDATVIINVSWSMAVRLIAYSRTAFMVDFIFKPQLPHSFPPAASSSYPPEYHHYDSCTYAPLAKVAILLDSFMHFSKPH
jgi:hypothetical protein